MPKLAAAVPVPNTAPGQAVTRARKIAAKRGSVPAPNVEPRGGGEFKGQLTPEELASLPKEVDPFDGDGSTAAGPEASATPAKKTVAKRAPAKKTVAKPAPVEEPTAPDDDDAWFAPLAEEDDYLNILWYGLEGSTKTTSLATASAVCPPGSKILIINAEGGLKVKALKKHGVDVSKIRVFPDPKSDDVLDDASLERVFLRVQADLIATPGSWFAVGIDSITDVGQQLVDHAQSDRVNRLIKSKVQGVDKNFVDRDDYGVSTKILRKWLRRLRDLPCHFLVTALERRDVDEDTNKVMYGPAVSPSVATDLLGYVDIAIMIKAADSEGKPIRGLTKEGGKYRVKDRFEVLPRVMVEPTFDRVLEYFNESVTEADDPYQASLPPARAKKGAILEEVEDTQDK